METKKKQVGSKEWEATVKKRLEFKNDRNKKTIQILENFMMNYWSQQDEN